MYDIEFKKYVIKWRRLIVGFLLLDLFDDI